jgi:hypothetical protein
LCGRDDCYVHLCGRDDSYLHTCWHGNRYLHVEVCDPRPATDFRLLALFAHPDEGVHRFRVDLGLGVVSVADWRPDDESQPRLTPVETATYGAVGRVRYAESAPPR